MKKRISSQTLVGPTPGSRLSVTNRRRLLAPSLASAVVLLAVVGLSRELLMHEPPTFHATPVRQRNAGDLLTGPMADRRSDDGSYPVSQLAGQEAKEIDQLQPGGSREFDFRKEPQATAALRAQDKQENERLAESSLKTPAEEIRQHQLRKKADLENLDGDLKLAANKPASLEYEEPARERKAIIAKSPVTPVIGGAFSDTDNIFNFLGHYQQTGNLYFQPATGYWANTYIPGDPEIRLLSARLARWDRSWLQHNGALEQEVEPLQQPFDAPLANALALSLMADTNAISLNDDGDTRMRLQVGIRGIEHRRGQRPAMNVGVVVDLPADAPDEVRIATRALLDAMLQSKQAGDRFSLVMTGSGLVVDAPDFRFGSMQLVKQHILGQRPVPIGDNSTSTGLELHAALQRASAMVQQSDDPSRPLGSSSVLLISAGSLTNVEQLAALAHQKATHGVTLSVVPLGNRPQPESVEKLVLSGLGNRRYLEAPGRARQLIEEELHASSRAVARAARLSIRLARGVRLINVVGSERLDIQRSQRVREIENSMDHRLSTNLGIQADRGEDEDGIQIVIPSIFSGDDVTVLLDVVTDHPGAIADVSLRYKDLVFLRNGSLQAHLELPGGKPKRGPAELSVLKNLLSHHFAETVEQAAAALGQHRPAAAIAILRAMHETIGRARHDIPAWANDPDLTRDQQVLDRYLAALGSPRIGPHQSFLTDSLRYAAWAKTHRPLEEWKQ